MIVLLAIAALLAGSPALAQSAARSAAATHAQQGATVAKLVEHATGTGMKTLLYAEIDDGREGRATAGMQVIAQPPGDRRLVRMEGDDLMALRRTVASEAIASGKDGWRRILIIVDNGKVTIERSPSPGRLEGFNARLRVAVDRVFPGHA